LRAWADLLVVDHGIFRLIYLNRHRVTPDLYRSAQPSPLDIRAMAREGIRTLVVLRSGKSHGAWQLQREAANAAGIRLIDCPLRSRSAPDREMLLGLPAFFSSLDYPVMAHCKSGADRAGLFAALYLLIREGADAARAKRELCLGKGHFSHSQTGILDCFLDRYAREGEARGKAFLEWVREDYDPEGLSREFRPSPIVSLFADRLLRRE
jgi:uncharacterized protein (TIGR01244 family)